ncbi:MAG: 30S ribosomal protein S17 [Spirochaetaceae bacterium]|jgi:small subunit ribosomal protein S17|nr:30S ribosomal protein S17 [Spirochaetaceae bacterium]
MSDQAKVAKSGKKEFVGLVKNIKRVEENGKVIGMNKTIVVSVETMALHSLYKKYVRKVKRIKAHDEENTARTGDKVRVMECRPISKDKCWKLVEVVERAK